MNRRQFISKTAVAGLGLSIVPSSVLGGNGRVAPSDKINVALIGSGTQALKQLPDWLDRKELQFVSVCDPNRESYDYPQWGQSQGETKGAAGGREIGRKMINQFYAEKSGKSSYDSCTVYADFRELKIMKRRLVTLLSVLFCMSTLVFSQNKNSYEQEGYRSLFNGQDLTGWKIPQGDNGHWSVIDGVIDYDARSEAKGSKDLMSEKEYGDFKLHVEWRFKGYGDHLFPLPVILPSGDYLKDNNEKIIEPLGPNSDSGILLKGVGQTNLWCWSVGSGELWSVRNDASLSSEVRAAAVPKENADKPVGQWNAFDILVKGERITIINNGITVIDNALYPGLSEKGPIGLQHHGGVNSKTGKLEGASSLIQFRNIWIQEL